MQYQFRTLETKKELKECIELLKSHSLSFEENVDYTIGLYDGDFLIATGSLYENVIKMIAVDYRYQGENLTALILTHLVLKLGEKNIFKYFIFTKPENKQYFESFSFSLITETKDIVLFENNFYTIKERLEDLKVELNIDGPCAAIVMNCNPVTLGHLYLIETVCSKHQRVVIFLVEEDRSLFPFKVRKELLEKATAHLKNLKIMPSTVYIISRTTFPSYFIKKYTEASKIHMMLDATIFKDYFMRTFNIEKRYVGSEPTDITTNAYNETLKSILKDQLVIIDRLMIDEKPISASFIRQLAQKKDYETLKKFVPKVTYQFIKSKKGKMLFDHR
jgi:[citrate (pro-3S)-lyase] ligase